MPGELFTMELIEAGPLGPPVLPVSVFPLPEEALASWLLRYAAPFAIAPEALILGDAEMALAADPNWWRTPDPLIVAAIRRAIGTPGLLALADVRDGTSVEAAAWAAQVIPRTLYNWLRRGAERGLDAALEQRPRGHNLAEAEVTELANWIAAAPPDGPRWRSNRVVNEAARRFGVEITVHVAGRLLRRYGPWPRRRLRSKRRLSVASVYD